MRNSSKTALLLGLCVLFAGSASAAAPSASRVLYDLGIERPLGLAQMALGLSVALVAYPLALGSDKSAEVIDRCVTQPGRYTFTRSLGDFRQPMKSQCSPVGLGFSLSRLALGVLGRPLEFLFGTSPLAPERLAPDELEAGTSRGGAREGAPGLDA